MADNITTLNASSVTVTVATSDDGTAQSPKVVSWTVQPTATLTRPGDTTAYTANDSVANSTGSPTALTFSNCARVTGGCGLIRDATLILSGMTTTVAEFHLWVFDTSPTVTADNSAFNPSDGDAANVQCVLMFNAGNMSDGTSNRVYKLVNAPQMFKTSGALELYGALMTRTGYTPTSGETYQFDLDIVQEI